MFRGTTMNYDDNIEHIIKLFAITSDYNDV